MAAVLVCACGRRLAAEGAKPGRVGRCPGCGATFRVPDRPKAPAPPVDIAESEPALGPAGYGLSDAPEPPRRRAARRTSAEPPTMAVAAPAQGVTGPLPVPRAIESSAAESLLYPFWGSTGVAALVALPPFLGAAFIFVVGLYVPILLSGGAFVVLAVIMTPVVVCCLAVGGFAARVLADVLRSSAWGEIHHPRWPHPGFGECLAMAARWIWAGVAGWLIGGLPALAYWVYCGDLDWLDGVVLAELIALGAAYAQMALVAVLLFDDWKAANPWTVLRAIRAIGWPYLKPCLLAGAASLMTIGLIAVGNRLPGGGQVVVFGWLIWVVLIYQALVLLRVLGLCYHRAAARVGWFPERPRWGVRT